jgi:hypothetical protein
VCDTDGCQGQRIYSEKGLVTMFSFTPAALLIQDFAKFAKLHLNSLVAFMRKWANTHAATSLQHNLEAKIQTLRPSYLVERRYLVL